MSTIKKQPKYSVAGVTDLREIILEQEYKCALTGEKLTPQNTSYDHIIPLSRGGGSLKKNLQAVTKEANLSKADHTMREYVELCFKVLKNHGKKYGIKVTKN